MNKKIAIIGTDPRLNYLQQSVSDYLDTQLYPTMTWDKELRETVFSYEPDIVFLPIQPIHTEGAFELPTSCQTVFIGKSTESIEKAVKKDNIQSFYYLEDEEWIWDNANLTAEGFINYFYSQEKQVIYNKEFIITGYGRVGKRLALALHHLGAKVIISVRSEHQLYEAKSYGYKISTLDNLFEEQMRPSVYMINTIPFKWLKNENAVYFKRVFDLASNPGCLIDVENTPLNYSLSTSLPGMYFPQDAGQLLARAVLKHLAFLEEEK